MKFLVILFTWSVSLIVGYFVFISDKINLTYLALNLFSILIPISFSFDKKVTFLNYFYPVLYSTLITSCIFIPWDVLFTTNKVWSFNPTYISGIYILGLPIEEILFFLLIPYSSLFIYENISYYFKDIWSPKIGKKINFVLAISFLLIGVLFFDKLYAAICFSLTAVVLLINQYVLKISYLGKFYFSFLFVLIVFLIFDSFIAGHWLDEPIVYYNPNDIINFRILSIPIEDFVYCILFILINVNLYEHFKQKQKTIV